MTKYFTFHVVKAFNDNTIKIRKSSVFIPIRTHPGY